MSDSQYLTSPAHPERTISYFTGVGTREEVVRTFRRFQSEFPLDTKYHYLHHVLEQNDFFRELLEALTEEIQFIIEEEVHPSAIQYNPLFYPGMDEYNANLTSVATLLNHEPDYFLTPYMFNVEDHEVEWKKFDINSVQFMHRFRNSYMAYQFIFSRIWRHGGIYLEVYYPEGMGTGILNEYTDKAVRLVDNRSVGADWLPPIGNWPKVGYLTGLESYNQFERLYAFRFDDRARPEWDTGIEYGGDISEIEDEEGNYLSHDVDVDPAYIFDTVNFPWVKDRTVILSITADRILNLQRNSLRTALNDCLMDIPFLQYVRRQAMQHKKIVEKIKVGTQLTLACDTSGEFVKSGDSAHTIPDIRADVTIIPRNYEANAEPARIRLGTGEVDGALRNRLFRRPNDFQKQAVYGESSVFDWSTYMGPDVSLGDPEDLTEIVENEQDAAAASIDDFMMVNPVFSTTLGEFEVTDVTGNVRAINTMIEMRRLEGTTAPILLGSPELSDPDDFPGPTSVGFPHEYIAAGSFEGTFRLDTFYVRLAAKRMRASESVLTLTRKHVPLKNFFFNLDAQEDLEALDILPRILFNYETLRFFGGDREDPPIDPQGGWIELIDAMNNDYLWPFADLRSPGIYGSTGHTLGSYLLTLDPLVDNIQQKVEEYLLDGNTEWTIGDTSEYSHVQAWLQERRWFEFYPVDDYNVEGEAPPLPEEDYLSDLKFNWRGRGWNSWYEYVPQFIWQSYVVIREGVDTVTGEWDPEPEYYIFNEFTFRQALRFLGEEVGETTLSDDFVTRGNLLEILDEFFLSLGRESIYGATQKDLSDEWLDFVQEDHQGFFDPMFSGALDTIPEPVLHNYLRIDRDYEYEMVPQGDPDGAPELRTGIKLDLREGLLEFQMKVYDHLDKFVEPTLAEGASDLIDQRAPRSNVTRQLRLRYTINTSTDFADADDLEARIVGIREAGIFNTEGKLIAYATFPPIIYDSFENHLAINWYISTIQFAAP